MVKDTSEYEYRKKKTVEVETKECTPAKVCVYRYTPSGLYCQRELTCSAAPTGGSAETV